MRLDPARDRNGSRVSTALLCYDGSGSARHAIERAADLVDAKAIVLHVWQPTSGAHVGERFADIVVDLDRAAELESHSLADEGARLAREAGLEAESLSRSGHDWDEIVKAAKELDVALIVLGTRGAGTLRRDVLGSVASAVVHHADRPVLVIPPEGDEPSGPS
jgi:nucleotide-binding universal stress UspA family protein